MPKAAERRKELYALMGRLPDRQRPVGAEKKSEQERRRLHSRDVAVRSERDRAGAGVSRTSESASGRAPAVLFNHSHGGGYTIGKKEFIEGRSYLQPEPYAKTLTDLGYVASGSITGCSASAATTPKRTRSRRCCGKGACCGE